MNTPKISVCSKICNECGFTGATKDTLYAEFYNIVSQGTLFPCHKYLKSQTGNESYGTETLKEVKVCRGYVAFVRKYGLIAGIASNYPFMVRHWQPLLNEIRDDELKQILPMNQLKKIHKGLRENIYLGN